MNEHKSQKILFYFFGIFVSADLLAAPITTEERLMSTLRNLMNWENSQDLIQAQSDILETFHSKSAIQQLEKIGAKRIIDQYLQGRLNGSNHENFSNSMHSSGFTRLYNLLLGEGQLHEIVSRAKLDFEISEKDLAYLRRRFWGKRFMRRGTLKNAITTLGVSSLHSGFPANSLGAVISSGQQDGVGYGPPGSNQFVEGIYTTTERSMAHNWGKVAASNGQTLWLKDSERKGPPYSDAVTLEYKMKEGTRMLDMTDVKSPVLNQLLSEIRRDPKHSVRLNTPSIPAGAWENGWTVLMKAFDVSVISQTVYMDVGVQMGTELVIVDRSAIESRTIGEVNGRSIADEVQLLAKKKSLALAEFKRSLSDREFDRAALMADNILETYADLAPYEITDILRELQERQLREYLDVYLSDNVRNFLSLPSDFVGVIESSPNLIEKFERLIWLAAREVFNSGSKTYRIFRSLFAINMARKVRDPASALNGWKKGCDTLESWMFRLIRSIHKY